MSRNLGMNFDAARRKWEAAAEVAVPVSSRNRAANADDPDEDGSFPPMTVLAKALARERAVEAEKQRELRVQNERDRKRQERDKQQVNSPMTSAEFMNKAATIAARTDLTSQTGDSHGFRGHTNSSALHVAARNLPSPYISERAFPRDDTGAQIQGSSGQAAASVASSSRSHIADNIVNRYDPASRRNADHPVRSVPVNSSDPGLQRSTGSKQRRNNAWSDAVDNVSNRYTSGSSRPVAAVNQVGRRHSEKFRDNDDDDDHSGCEVVDVQDDNWSGSNGDNARGSSDYDDYDDDDDGDDDDHRSAGVSADQSDGERSEEQLVRQNSNFSRLSAQSWLTVDSAEDLDDSGNANSDAFAFSVDSKAMTASSSAAPADASSRHPVGRLSAAPAGGAASSNRRDDSGAFSELPDLPKRDSIPAKPVLVAATHMDVRQGERRATGGLMDVMDVIRGKGLTTKTVLESAIELMAGMPAYKKKAFRRFGVRRVWLSADCERLCWTSKKDGVESDFIRLSRVARMRCVDRELSVDVMEGHRIALLFANAQEASMWIRCLSFLTPLQSRVRSSASDIVPSEKDREDYNLVDDYFNGKPLLAYGSVNAYVVLGPVKGHSGEARLVLSRADKAFFSMRYITPTAVPFLLRSHEEIAVLKRLSHPNLVKYHECLLDPSRGGNYMIFEYTPRGVVTETYRLEGVSPIPERAARIILRDVINALEYMHALRIVHADVRPDNLLRAVNSSVKVNPIGCITQDFTEIRDMTALVKARLGSAPPAFLAPELCWHGAAPRLPHKSYAMDVWAVGAVLYFLLYGRVPFGGSTSKEIQENICRAKLKFPRLPETSSKVRNLLKGVLGEKDPKTRIGLSELKQHPWFAEGLDEEHVYQSRGPINFRLVVSPEEVDSAVAHGKVKAPARS